MAANITSYGDLRKPVFADQVLEAPPRPEREVLTDLGDIRPGKKHGKQYEVAVQTKRSQNFTYLGQNNDSEVTLNEGVSAQYDTASVKGHEIIAADRIISTILAEASEKGPKAYDQALRRFLVDLRNTADARLEYGMVNGGAGVFKVAANANTIVSSASSGAITLKILAVDWADAIGTDFEGAVLQFRDSDGNEMGNGAAFKITGITASTSGSYNVALQEVTVTNSVVYAATNITSNTNAEDLESDISGSPLTDAYAWFYGSYGNETDGLVKVANTSSGNLFSIPVASNYNWGPSQLTVTGDISLAFFQQVGAKLRSRGAQKNAGWKALVSASFWQHLHDNEFDAIAQLNTEGGKTASRQALGANDLFVRTQIGDIQVSVNNCIKSGEFVVYAPKYISRVGTYNWRMAIPGTEEMFMRVPKTNAYEGVLHTIQGFFTDQPKNLVYVTGYNLA